VGHTTLVFKDRAEYFHDADLLVILHLLIEKARSLPAQGRERETLIQSWQHACDTTGPGFVDLRFNAMDDAARKYMLALVKAVQGDLNGIETLPTSALGEWRVPDLIIGEHYDAGRLRAALVQMTSLLS
jgi:hypothetical protein